MMKYKVELHFNTGKITELECIKETEKYVVIAQSWLGKPIERKEMKKTSCHEIFDTWQLAYQFLYENTERKLRMAENNLASAVANFEAVKAMATLNKEAA